MALFGTKQLSMPTLAGFLITGLLTEHPHFPSWPEWLPYVKATVYAIGGYLAGKLGVNNVGQILKKDKPIVHVDAQALDQLKAKADLAETEIKPLEPPKQP